MMRVSIDQLGGLLNEVCNKTAYKSVFLRWSSDGQHLSNLSYGETQKYIRKLGQQFALWGLVPGDRIVIATKNDAVMATGVLACLSYGITAMVFDYDSTFDEVSSLLDIQKPNALMLDQGLVAAWKLPESLPTLMVAAPNKKSFVNKLLRRPGQAKQGHPSFFEVLDALDERALDTLDLDPQSDAYLLYTSGSTSKPKGVRISRSALFAQLQTLINRWQYSSSSRILDILPLHHADGLVQGVLCAWFCGGTCVRTGNFRVDAVLRLLVDPIYTERITHLVSVPTMLALVLEYAKNEVDAFKQEDFKFVISAAGYLDEVLWKDFEQTFGVRVCNMYGLTETVTGACFAGPDDESHVIGSVGMAVDCEVKIVSDEGEELGDGETGELLIKGDQLLSGYVNDAAATQDVFVDGWLKSGDLATKDGVGIVRIVGRKKNLVISGGLNIQPEEVAELLREQSGVRDAVAFGVPDETFTEILVACVSAEEDVLDLGHLIQVCRDKLSAFKVPKDIVQVPSLPYGPSGKVIIPKVRALYEISKSGLSQHSDGDVRERVIAIAAESFRVPKDVLSDADAPGSTYGWDSFAHLTFIHGIESAFKIRISTQKIIEIRSLGDAIRVVRGMTSA